MLLCCVKLPPCAYLSDSQNRISEQVKESLGPPQTSPAPIRRAPSASSMCELALSPKLHPGCAVGLAGGSCRWACLLALWEAQTPGLGPNGQHCQEVSGDLGDETMLGQRQGWGISEVAQKLAGVR